MENGIVIDGVSHKLVADNKLQSVELCEECSLRDICTHIKNAMICEDLFDNECGTYPYCGCHFEIDKEKRIARLNRKELEKMVKKPHLSFVEEVIGLYDTIDKLNKQNDKLQNKVRELEDENKHLKSVVDAPKMKLADAIGEYISEMTLKRDDVSGIVKEDIEKHLDVSVETDGYYDGYSGNNDHYHKSEVTVKWKEE